MRLWKLDGVWGREATLYMACSDVLLLDLLSNCSPSICRKSSCFQRGNKNGETTVFLHSLVTKRLSCLTELISLLSSAKDFELDKHRKKQRTTEFEGPLKVF